MTTIEPILSWCTSHGIRVVFLSQKDHYRADPDFYPDWWTCELYKIRDDGRICLGLGGGPSAYYALLAAKLHIEAEINKAPETLRRHVSSSEQLSLPMDRRAGEALLAKLGLGKVKPQVNIL